MTLYSASTGTQYCDLNEIYSKWLIQTKFVLLVRAVVVIQVVMLRSAVEREGCLLGSYSDLTELLIEERVYGC